MSRHDWTKTTPEQIKADIEEMLTSIQDLCAMVDYYTATGKMPMRRDVKGTRRKGRKTKDTKR